MAYQSEKIRGAMHEQNITDEQLASQTGLSARTIQSVRDGKDVRMRTLETVATALGLKVRDLYDHEAA